MHREHNWLVGPITGGPGGFRAATTSPPSGRLKFPAQTFKLSELFQAVATWLIQATVVNEDEALEVAELFLLLLLRRSVRH